jgi:NAD(P)-dependent dehydrogenase (short-subunit alcohol dehydrogenase family)
MATDGFHPGPVLYARVAELLGEVIERDEQQIVDAARATAEKFGGIDILINNASAISLTPTEATPMQRFDLMIGVNTRGTFLCMQACLPYLKTAALQMIPGVRPEHCRSAEIRADAAYAVLTSDAAATTGNFFIDEEVLGRAGVTACSRDAVVPGSKQLMPDLFL